MLHLLNDGHQLLFGAKFIEMWEIWTAQFGVSAVDLVRCPNIS